jgi:hypothetical protein
MKHESKGKYLVLRDPWKKKNMIRRPIKSLKEEFMFSFYYCLLFHGRPELEL